MSKTILDKSELMCRIGDMSLGENHFYIFENKEDLELLLTKLYKNKFEHLVTGKNVKESASIIWERYGKDTVVQTREYKLKNYRNKFKHIFFANKKYYIDSEINKDQFEYYYGRSN